MNEKTRTVYYCDHCRKHGLSRYAMAQHEDRCTMNPARTCRWGGRHALNFPYLSGALQERAPLGVELIDWLRDEVDGCPACMLAALRQSGLADYHYDTRSQRIFDYDAEVARARAAEREEARYDVY